MSDEEDLEQRAARLEANAARREAQGLPGWARQMRRSAALLRAQTATLSHTPKLPPLDAEGQARARIFAAEACRADELWPPATVGGWAVPATTTWGRREGGL